MLNTDVSDKLVQEFKDDYLQSRESIGASEKLFRYFHAFARSNESKESSSSGFNVNVPIGSLIKNSNWAPLRGWEFAVAEERYLLQRFAQILLDSVSETGSTIKRIVPRTATGILSGVDELSKRLEAMGYSSRVGVVASHLDIDLLVDLQKRFTTEGWELPTNLRTNWILGRHRDMPVLYIKSENQALNRLFAIDLPQFAGLTQFDPSVELAVEARQAHARVHLYQTYEFNVRDRKAVWSARLEEPRTSDGS